MPPEPATAGPLRAIRVDHLEPTDRGIRLTLPHTEGEPTQAVTIPLPYGDAELCPVRALKLLLEAAARPQSRRRPWR